MQICTNRRGTAVYDTRFRHFHQKYLFPALALICLLCVVGCSSGPKKTATGLTAPDSHLFDADRGANGGTTGLENGVNAYLWRASLDTISFMPVSSADAQGGTIMTDWYTPPAAHNERFKIIIFILGRVLRTDTLRLTVFRQIWDNNRWIDSPPAPNTSSDIATRILMRARKLRVDSGGKP